MRIQGGEHLRSNLIGYVSLSLSLLALSSGAYAALSLPHNSVGGVQIRNHSIDAVKLDPRTIGGAIRHWAEVDSRGRIVSSSSRASDDGVPPDGDYLVTWSDTFSSRCIATVTPLASPALLSPPSGIADARVVNAHPTEVWISTFSAQGAPAPAAFSVAVIC